MISFHCVIFTFSPSSLVREFLIISFCILVSSPLFLFPISLVKSEFLKLFSPPLYTFLPSLSTTELMETSKCHKDVTGPWRVFHNRASAFPKFGILLPNATFVNNSPIVLRSHRHRLAGGHPGWLTQQDFIHLQPPELFLTFLCSVPLAES